MRRYWIIATSLAVLAATVAVALGLKVAGTGGEPEPAQAAEAGSGPAPAPEPGGSQRMLVATRYLPVGRLVEDGDLAGEPLPAAEIPRGALGEGKAKEALGSAIRVAVDAGAAIVDTDLVRPGARGFLALILAPGMRAVSVAIGPATRQAGLIDPGDRVDVIFTASPPAVEGLESETFLPTMDGARLSRTIFEDLRVLAIDRTVRAPSLGGEDPPDERSEIATATLEVAPEQAPALIHAGREGTLGLVVRSARAAAPGQAPVTPTVDVGHLLLPDATRTRPPPIGVARRVTVVRSGGVVQREFHEDGTPREDEAAPAAAAGKP